MGTCSRVLPHWVPSRFSTRQRLSPTTGTALPGPGRVLSPARALLLVSRVPRVQPRVPARLAPGWVGSGGHRCEQGLAGPCSPSSSLRERNAVFCCNGQKEAAFPFAKCCGKRSSIPGGFSCVLGHPLPCACPQAAPAPCARPRPRHPRGSQEGRVSAWNCLWEDVGAPHKPVLGTW